MKVVLKDCLELDTFKNAKVLAGAKALEHRVKSVSVLESTSSSRALERVSKHDELVITGLFGIESDTAAQLRIISALAQSGNAGIILISDDEVYTPDKEVIATANRAGMPIILMGGRNVPSSGEIISEVMDRILYGDNFGNRLISNTIFHLLDFERHSNFQSALREAAINNNFQIIIMSENFNPILTVETRHKASIADAIRLGKEHEFENSAVYTMVDVDGVLTYWGPVMIAGEKHFMFIVDNDDSYSAGEITKLAEIIELAMGMWKYTPERDVRAEFIKALRRGNKSLAYTLRQEAGIDGEDILSVFFAKGIERDETIRVLTAFEKEERLRIMKITEGEETYGMIISSEGGGEEESVAARANCIKLYNKLKEEKSIRIFHVTGLDGIEGAADAYRLISECWSFAQAVFPYKRVFTKYELALISNCINIQLHGGFLKKNYMELLDGFKEAGENKGRQLLETLETFVLDAGMNSSKTSEFMGIHTNTVQYRLKRINDILGVEITGNRVIPGLTIALALTRLERVVH